MSDNPFRMIGSDASWPPPPPAATVTSERLLQTLAYDPQDPMGNARLRGLSRVLEGRRKGRPRTTVHELVDTLGRMEPVPYQVVEYDNPMRLRSDVPKRALTAADFEFLRCFDGVDPAAVSAEDAALLAELEAAADSETARRVAARLVDPVRCHFDRLEEQAQVRNELAQARPSNVRSDPKVLNVVAPILAEQIAGERRAQLENELQGVSPELREQTLTAVDGDSQREARDKLKELWGRLEDDKARRREQATARLSELARGADPQTSKPEPRTSAKLEDGRRRGREHREQREMQVAAFEKLTVVGGSPGSAA